MATNFPLKPMFVSLATADIHPKNPPFSRIVSGETMSYMGVYNPYTDIARGLWEKATIGGLPESFIPVCTTFVDMPVIYGNREDMGEIVSVLRDVRNVKEITEHGFLFCGTLPRIDWKLSTQVTGEARYCWFTDKLLGIAFDARILTNTGTELTISIAILVTLRNDNGDINVVPTIVGRYTEMPNLQVSDYEGGYNYGIIRGVTRLILDHILPQGDHIKSDYIIADVIHPEQVMTRKPFHKYESEFEIVGAVSSKTIPDNSPEIPDTDPSQFMVGSDDTPNEGELFVLPSQVSLDKVDKSKFDIYELQCGTKLLFVVASKDKAFRIERIQHPEEVEEETTSPKDEVPLADLERAAIADAHALGFDINVDNGEFVYITDSLKGLVSNQDNKLYLFGRVYNPDMDEAEDIYVGTVLYKSTETVVLALQCEYASPIIRLLAGRLGWNGNANEISDVITTLLQEKRLTPNFPTSAE